MLVDLIMFFAFGLFAVFVLLFILSWCGLARWLFSLPRDRS